MPYDIREKKERLGPNASRIMGKGYAASTSLNPGIWGMSFFTAAGAALSHCWSDRTVAGH